MGEKIGAKLLQPFIEIGRQFGENGAFQTEIIGAKDSCKGEPGILGFT